MLTWGGVQKDAHLAQAGDTRFFRNLLQGAGWDEWHCMTSQTHNMSTPAARAREGKPPTQEPELLTSSAMSLPLSTGETDIMFTANKKMLTEFSMGSQNR